MTETQLHKGNDLHHTITRVKGEIKEINKTIRETLLRNDSFVIDESKQSIKVMGKECIVDKEKLVKFLESERKTQETKLKKIELEFKSI